MTKAVQLHQNVQFTDSNEILKENRSLEKVNRYVVMTPEMELKSTEVDFKLFTVQKATLWRVAKIAVVVASIALAVAAVSLVTVYAAPLTFPVLFGIGILYYKLHPKVIHPLDIKHLRASLYRSNLEGIIQKQNELKSESKLELRKRFEKLGIHTQRYKIDPKSKPSISEDKALTLLIPLLARFEFFKEQIDKTEEVQNQLFERIEEIRHRIQLDDDYSLTAEEALDLENEISNAYAKLKELSSAEESEDRPNLEEARSAIIDMENQRKLTDDEKTELIKELVSITYKIDDLDEDDALGFQLNSRLLSSIKSAYILDLMHDLTQKKMISEFGHFNSHVKHVRVALEGTPSGDDYFVTNKKPHIGFGELKENLRDFDYLRQRFFHPEQEAATDKQA